MGTPVFSTVFNLFRQLHFLSNTDEVVPAVTLVDSDGNEASGSGAGVLAVVGKYAAAGANFTSATGTTPYSIGDVIANSATAGSVVALAVTAARANDATGMVRRARLKTTDTGAAGATVRVHLYKTDPAASSGITNGDNAAWLTKEALYIGSLDVVLDKHFSDVEKGIGAPLIGSEINFEPATGTQLIYALLEARSAFTPVGAKVWTLVLEVLQN